MGSSIKWLSRDPLGDLGGVNLYAYVLVNPVNLNDPLGLCCSNPICRLSKKDYWDLAQTYNRNALLFFGFGTVHGNFTTGFTQIAWGAGFIRYNLIAASAFGGAMIGSALGNAGSLIIYYNYDKICNCK